MSNWVHYEKGAEPDDFDEATKVRETVNKGVDFFDVNI